jgi:hypothetical protein
MWARTASPKFSLGLYAELEIMPQSVSARTAQYYSPKRLRF